MSAYEERRRRHVEDMLAMVPEHLDRLDWSAERLRLHRQGALRRLIRTAIERSPWHRQRLAGVDLDRVGEANVHDLPVMTKDDLMTNFDEIVTNPRLRLDVCNAHLETLTDDAYLFGRYHVIASGGSTGRRGVFVYDWDEWATMYVGLQRYEFRRQAEEGGSRRGPIVMTGVAAGRASHASRALMQTFTTEDRMIGGVPITLPVDEIVAGLNKQNPDILFAYPSAILPLADKARAGELRIRPRRILLGAEPLLPEIRAAAEETWNVPVINVYGSSEGGAMGIACGHGPGLHLAEDLCIIEAVDADGRAVAAGERSAKIYLTNLYNHTLPLIRYEITDEVTPLSGPCPCGSAHRVIDDPQGRLDDLFHYGSLIVHPLLFRSPLGLCRDIIEYQVHQTPRGADITVRCQGPTDLMALAGGIRGKLVTAGLDDPEVTITVLDQLPRQDTGKLKRFIPLAPAAAHAA